MFQTFYPHEYKNSTYEICFEQLYRQGYRAVLFDIDNTLVPHDADADERAVALFERLRAIGYKTCLVSNNKEPRVKRFNEQIQSEYVYKAGKPLAKGYQEAIARLGVSVEQTLYVGDQLFTDVWGAKLIGLHCILVKPMNPKEEIQIVLKRYLERIVLHCYTRKKNIILIGYMGCGKSTLSRLLAQDHNRHLIDTDSFIETREGMSISELFEQKGERYFRDLETTVLEELLESTYNTVIATGGGLPLRDANAELLKRLGTVVYLKASADTIYERVKDETNRPLLNVPNPREKIEKMLAQRNPIYEQVADYTVEVDNLTVGQTLQRIRRLDRG
jgi:hypothetical protein